MNIDRVLMKYSQEFTLPSMNIYTIQFSLPCIILLTLNTTCCHLFSWGENKESVRWFIKTFQRPTIFKVGMPTRSIPAWGHISGWPWWESCQSSSWGNSIWGSSQCFCPTQIDHNFHLNPSWMMLIIILEVTMRIMEGYVKHNPRNGKELYSMTSTSAWIFY